MTKELLQVKGQITKITTLADGGLNLTVNTPDLIPEDITLLMGMKNQLGYFIFKLSHMEAKDIINLPDEPIEPFVKHKSQSQRIYDTLFVLWKQRGEVGKFEDFYKKQTEKIIEAIKEKLEPRNV